jgi:penicillin-binding protein 1C
MEIEGHEVAVKTGTSYEHRDNWTAGYTPSYAVGVWVGHADGSPMIDPDGTLPTTGASGAAPLWHAAMENVLRDRPVEKFVGIRENENRGSRVGAHGHVPLQPKPEKSLRILSPVANATFRIHSYLPAEHQKIAAEAGAASNDNLRWYLDGRFLASSRAKEHVWILPQTGKHTLRVEDEKGLNEEIAFRVVNEQND